ncbi:hypothetical protein KFU94_55605 [Chloroflexi bacterium TSY]|nr:hypothetical protein [Chloroflexi bacterium TSY]
MAQIRISGLFVHIVNLGIIGIIRNVFIFGAALEHSPEAAILDRTGFGGINSPNSSVVISDALVQQIRRVARRVRNQDWAGQILSQIFNGMQIDSRLPKSSTHLARFK